MNLFDIIPENFFSIFQGKNRAIYAESLITLFDLLQNDESLISKNDFIKTLKDKNKDIESFSYEGEDLDDEEDSSLLMDTISSKASFICRRLEETGWIDIAMDPDTFDETIILPVYSIMMVRSFKDIISDEESPYLSLVHSTYSELKLEDEDQDELLYTTLDRCYNNTKKLKVELVTLVHSIRIFQNKLGKIFVTNKVLHDYFDVYKNKISDRYYHPLKTFDSVAKFRRPIIKILDGWIKDKDIRNRLIQQACIQNGTVDKKKIESDIITKINYITDTYDTINSLISSIDKEHNLYTKNSANKILYLNNTDKTIKGHLENIFKHYGIASQKAGRELGNILSGMQNCISFYDQGYIDSKSVTLPVLRKYRNEEVPLEMIDFTEVGDVMMKNFLNEAMNIYTDEKVYEFMDNVFGESEEVYSQDIPLLDYDAFVLLILATVKKDDDDCFYTIEEVDDEKIYNHGYIIPNFLFKKKQNMSKGA
ncbi:MAG: hypothetical protein H6689_03330 [Erysipelotrichaceae bacterium]|nr:hypothetical protein [Erysipelotrichaceae bacterium]